ncbi:hypothetical protein JCM1840_002679 [Sporobolomyces johnsonii]
MHRVEWQQQQHHRHQHLHQQPPYLLTPPELPQPVVRQRALAAVVAHPSDDYFTQPAGSAALGHEVYTLVKQEDMDNPQVEDEQQHGYQTWGRYGTQDGAYRQSSEPQAARDHAPPPDSRAYHLPRANSSSDALPPPFAAQSDPTRMAPAAQQYGSTGFFVGHRKRSYGETFGAGEGAALEEGVAGGRPRYEDGRPTGVPIPGVSEAGPTVYSYAPSSSTSASFDLPHGRHSTASASPVQTFLQAQPEPAQQQYPSPTSTNPDPPLPSPFAQPPFAQQQNGFPFPPQQTFSPSHHQSVDPFDQLPQASAYGAPAVSPSLPPHLYPRQQQGLPSTDSSRSLFAAGPPSANYPPPPVRAYSFDGPSPYVHSRRGPPSAGSGASLNLPPRSVSIAAPSPGVHSYNSPLPSLLSRRIATNFPSYTSSSSESPVFAGSSLPQPPTSLPSHSAPVSPFETTFPAHSRPAPPFPSNNPFPTPSHLPQPQSSPFQYGLSPPHQQDHAPPQLNMQGSQYSYYDSSTSARHSISSAVSPSQSTFFGSGTPSASLPSTSSSTAASTLTSSAPLTGVRPETIPTLQLASTERVIHRTSAPVLAFNPAREPAASGKQLVHSEYGVTYAVASSGSSKGKAKSAEVPATCWTCGDHRAKVILRGSDLSGWAPRLNFTCLNCLPVEHRQDLPPPDNSAHDSNGGDAAGSGAEDNDSSAGGNKASGLPPPSEHDRVTFKDTFSGAVDVLVGDHDAGRHDQREVLLPPSETGKSLPGHIRRQALTCDVCDRIIGAGSISSLTPGQVPSFTVEVICRNCQEKYRPCSDCGGGGGRLTPGRWRCKELFPAGRRTCTLSHARNPPLSDIEYDVLRVTEIDPAKLESLEQRCRLVYFNTRLRTQARPEMLERADGLATTYAECEKLTVDGWSLLKPLMHVDVEASRAIRRFVGLQTSTPMKRRAKPKPGAPPKPEPEVDENVEKEVTGFVLVEHDLVKGAVFFAVVMPWAIAGDAFDATTILNDEVIKRVRSDLRQTNAMRKEQGVELYPEPWCVWGITPFKTDSRMTQSLSRRGFAFLEDYLEEHPDTDLTSFPPHRQIHVPNEFVRTFKIFIRGIDGDKDDEGTPGLSSGAGKGKARQRARKLRTNGKGSQLAR